MRHLSLATPGEQADIIAAGPPLGWRPGLTARRALGLLCNASSAASHRAIRTGELLTGIKSTVGHGNFLPWLESNIPFSRNTVTNYMRFYEYREKLEWAKIAHLNDAYDSIQDIVRESRNADQREKNQAVEDYYRTSPDIKATVKAIKTAAKMIN